MPEDVSLDVGGHLTRIQRAGTGDALIWLHDTLGSEWTVAHERLSAAHRLIAPSLPGFEDSATLGGIDAPEDVVFWLVDLLAALDLERATVLGCGLGGWMAAELAVRHPDRLERLILVDAYGLRVEGALAADEYALTPAMLRPLVFARADSDVALHTLPDLRPPESLERGLHARVAGARLAWQFPYDRKLRGRLPRARVPALVVWGERDRLVPAAHAHAFAAGLPEARVETIADAGHYPYLEATDRFVQVVETFLRAV